MANRNIPPEIIAAIKAAGFDVYLPATGAATYLWYSDGKNIAYMQSGYFGGYEFSTVHYPNQKTGTGFKLDIPQPVTFTAPLLRLAFITAPDWAAPWDRDSARKYTGIDEFLQSRRGQSALVKG